MVGKQGLEVRVEDVRTLKGVGRRLPEGIEETVLGRFQGHLPAREDVSHRIERLFPGKKRGAGPR